MDFLKRLATIKQVAVDNPPDLLTMLELLTTIAKDVVELKERLEKLEKEVG
jgi:hypothetical protein